VERSVKDMTFLSVVGLLLALMIYYFQIAIDWPSRKILSSVGECWLQISVESYSRVFNLSVFNLDGFGVLPVGFNKVEFDTILSASVPACVVMAAISFCFEALSALIE